MSLLYRNVAPVLFPSILWHTTEQSVHITFDDGPHPGATPIVLDILKQRDLRATFFLLGRNVQRFPDLARQISHDGHTIGNHSLTHTSMLLKPNRWQGDQIREAQRILQEVLQVTPHAFRPPFGHFDFRTIRAARTQGLRMVMWDVDARDFVTGSPKQITERVSRELQPGSVVLFHDNDRTSAALAGYLNPVLDNLEQRGLKCSPLHI